jgi:4-hydroxybenzoate polyprenyltransferase
MSDTLHTVRTLRVVVVVSLLSWIAGLLAAIAIGFRISGRPLVDATLLAFVPWTLGFAIYKAIESVRRKRFGADRARPPLSTGDAVLAMGAAIGGTLLLVGFVPRVFSGGDAVDFVLAIVGLLFWAYPIHETRRALTTA